MEKKGLMIMGGILLLLSGSAFAATLVDWNNLTNFPAGCSLGQAVVGINTTPTCQSFVTSSGDNTVTGSFIIHSVFSAVDSFQVEDANSNISLYVDQRNNPHIVYSTEHDPITTNTSNLGSVTKKWKNVYANTYLGQVMESQAVAGTSCTAACDKWDGYPNGSQWSCIRALNTSGTSYSCGDTTVRKDCLCQS